MQQYVFHLRLSKANHVLILFFFVGSFHLIVFTDKQHPLPNKQLNHSMVNNKETETLYFMIEIQYCCTSLLKLSRRGPVPIFLHPVIAHADVSSGA